jgi:dihydropteroate synthase
MRLERWTQERDRVLVMGILNVTPDSFFDGGRFASTETAIDHALAMEADGADIIDVGGESSRPGAQPIAVQEELDRIIPVIRGIRRASDVAISVDTTKATVAREALAAGATIVNDISALRFDEEMADVVADSGAIVVLMHMQRDPSTMQKEPHYDDVVAEVYAFLEERVRIAVARGIPANRVIVDPGIGFGKRPEHNLALLRSIATFADLGRPVLVGLSRKSFFGALFGYAPADRLEATIAANAIAVVAGADILRVHDAKEGRRTADTAFRLRPNAN